MYILYISIYHRGVLYGTLLFFRLHFFNYESAPSFLRFDTWAKLINSETLWAS